jgi:hypothetical protein
MMELGGLRRFRKVQDFLPVAVPPSRFALSFEFFALLADGEGAVMHVSA